MTLSLRALPTPPPFSIVRTVDQWLRCAHTISLRASAPEASGPLSRPRERARERENLASRGARRPLSLTLSPADGGEGTGKELAGCLEIQ